MEKPIFGAIALIAHVGLSLFAGEALENECMRIHFAGVGASDRIHFRRSRSPLGIAEKYVRT